MTTETSAIVRADRLVPSRPRLFVLLGAFVLILATPARDPSRQPSPWLRPAAAVPHVSTGIGILALGSKPPCDIYIDGRDLGLKTPQRDIRLRPGPHRVRLENRDAHIRETFTVHVRAGETTKIIRDFQ